MYICHLITPFVTVLILGITFLPAVNRSILRLLDFNQAASAIFRLFVVFLSVYITQLLVDRNCSIKHCDRISR